MKGHAGIDPDSEIITATTVTPGNAGDASVAEDLIIDLPEDSDAEHSGDAEHGGQTAAAGAADTKAERAEATDTEIGQTGGVDDAGDAGDAGGGGDGSCVYGDNAYGTGTMHERLERAGIESKCKTQQPVAAGGLFAKDRFVVDLDEDTVTCPAGQTAPIRRASNRAGVAGFGQACTGCPLREQCTTSSAGRSIHVGAYERQLAAARARQQHPDWVADYRATRPKVERKIGHLMRRRHGGRRARVRGRAKIGADFALLAAAVNLARLGVLAVASTPSGGWATAAG